MRGTFGTLDPRLMERMRLALVEALCTHFASPPFFDSRAGTERVRPLDQASLDAVGHFVHSVNYSALDDIDVSSNEVRRFLEGLFVRYLAVNPAFKQPRYPLSARFTLPRPSAGGRYTSGAACGAGWQGAQLWRSSAQTFMGGGARAGA